MRLIFIVIAIFILSGCTTKIPNVTEFRVSTDVQNLEFEQKGCKDSSLRVSQAFSSQTLMSKNMSYAVGKYEQNNYTQSEWAEAPNKAISAQIVKSIQATKLFKSIQNSKSRSKNGLVLETNIEDFMQYFQEDEKISFANVLITFTLMDAKTSNIIDSKSFHSKVDVDTLDANGGVVALNKALNKVLEDAIIWLSESCK